MAIDLSPLAGASRLLLAVPLRPRQGSRFQRMERRPAAGHDDLSGTRCLTDFLARVSRGSRGHATGVDYCQLRFRRAADQRMPGRAELTGVSFNLRLIQPAANGVEVEFHLIKVISPQ